VITVASTADTAVDEFNEEELKKGGKGGRGGGIWIFVSSGSSSQTGVAVVLAVAALAGACVMVL